MLNLIDEILNSVTWGDRSDSVALKCGLVDIVIYHTFFGVDV